MSFRDEEKIPKNTEGRDRFAALVMTILLLSNDLVWAIARQDTNERDEKSYFPGNLTITTSVMK